MSSAAKAATKAATKVAPRTEGAGLIQIYGLACLIGGLLWWLLNASGPLGFTFGPAVSGVIGAVLLVGLTGGPLGLLALRAVGEGRTRRIGRAGAAVALLGLLSDLAGQTLQTAFGFAVSEIGFLYAAGALLVGLGMLVLGTSVTAARGLGGWRRYAALAVGLYYPAMIPVQVVFFIGPNGAPSSVLLAFWGLTWALLGCAILSEGARRSAGGPPERRAIRFTRRPGRPRPEGGNVDGF